MEIKFNLEILILIGVIYLILVGHTLCGCANMPLLLEKFTNLGAKKKEGFSGASTNGGSSAQYSLGDYSKIDTSSWGAPDLTVVPGKPYTAAVQNILNRPEQPIPLPEGELLIFANTPFKPECCPSTYTNSTGCACITTKQYAHLTSRGGNNVPFSEY